MISTLLSFNLQATPCGELDLWEELLPGKKPRPSGRIVRRTRDYVQQDGRWPGYQFCKEQFHKFCTGQFKELGIEIDDYFGGSIGFASPQLEGFYKRMMKLREVVCFKSGAIKYKLTDDELTSCEWFVLSPEYRENSIDGGLFEIERCNTDRMPKDVNALGRNHVSEDFKQAVEKNQFTGAEFVWLRDTSRRPGRQWYRIIPHNPIGRGLDHDWLDPKTLTGTYWQSSVEPLHRRGINFFNQKQFKQGAGFGNPVKDGLLALFPPENGFLSEGLEVRSWFQRLLRSALPKTDFAFYWECGSGNRYVCFNRRVRDALVRDGILSLEECERSFLILDAAPLGVEVLDGTHPCSPPYEYERGKRLENLRKEVAEAWQNFSAKHSAPVPAMSFDETLKSLRHSIRKGRNQFNPPASIGSIHSATKGLPLKVPEMWCKVLAEANGAAIYGVFGDMIIQSAEHLHGCHKACTEQGLEHSPDFSRHLLHFANTGMGDFLSLDTSKVTADGDCPVVLMSHETYEPDRVWPSIPEFLEEVLEQEQGGH